MRDKGYNKEDETTNFDELIKELNSLLDKIPQIVESTKDNGEVDFQDKSSNLDLKIEEEKELVEKKNDSLEGEKKEDLTLISPELLNEEVNNSDALSETDKDEELKLKDVVQEESNTLVDFSPEIDLIKNESKDTDLEDNLDNTEEGNKLQKVFEIDSDIDLVDLKLEDENKSEDINLSFEQPLEKIISNNNISGYSLISDETKELIHKSKPEGILDERVRRIAIIYTSNYNEDNLRNFINLLDEISLSSREAPMFVERSIFMVYDENFSTESFVLNAQNEKVNGVVLLGELPIDRIYEIESAVSQLGCIFLNLKGMVSKSIVIDFILDLIAL